MRDDKNEEGPNAKHNRWETKDAVGNLFEQRAVLIFLNRHGFHVSNSSFIKIAVGFVVDGMRPPPVSLGVSANRPRKKPTIRLAFREGKKDWWPQSWKKMNIRVKKPPASKAMGRVSQ